MRRKLFIWDRCLIFIFVLILRNSAVFFLDRNLEFGSAFFEMG